MTAQGKYGHVYEVDLVRNVRSTKSKSSASDRYDLREYRQPSSRHIGCKFTFEARNPSYGRAGTERQAEKEGDRGPEKLRVHGLHLGVMVSSHAFTCAARCTL